MFTNHPLLARCVSGFRFALTACGLLACLAPAALKADPIKLTWAPPVLVNPVTINLTATNNVPALSSGVDYIIKLPTGTTRNKGVYINGGRNVVIIGGHIEMPTYDSSNPTYTGRAIHILNGDVGRIVHIEGILLTHTAQAQADFITINSDYSIVQVQNCRAEHLQGGQSQWHADVIQPWGGVEELRVDRLTASSTYQGLQLTQDLGYCGRYDIRNVNLTALPEWYSGAKGGYMMWLSSGTKAVPMVLSNVYIEPRLGRSLDKSVWPDKDAADLNNRPVVNNNFLTWPNLSFITGGIHGGSPATGDFVPEGTAGLNYISPGYLEESTVVEDTFEIGATAQTTPGTADNDAGDPLDILWCRANGGSSRSVTYDSTLVSNVLSYSPNWGNRAVVGVLSGGGISPVTLGSNPGDQITLSFDFRFTSLTNIDGYGSNMRFGLYNSNGTQFIADDTTYPANAVANNDFGYLARIGVTSSGGSAQATLQKETGSNGSATLGTDITSLTSTSSTPVLINNTTKTYAAEFIMTRASGSVDLDFLIFETTGGIYTLVGGASASDATNPYVTFDEVVVGFGGNQARIYMDNVLVQTVP